MKNKQQKAIVSATVFASFLTLGLISTLTFAPVVKSNAAESSAEVETIVRSVLAITTDESLLNFTLSPLAGGNSESKPVVVTVNTNSTGGYELYFSSEDNATAMTSTTTSDTIVSDFNSRVTLANMGINKWGYSLDDINFKKIPTLDDQAKIKDVGHFPESNERDTTVNIGIKIDDTIGSGVYSKVVKFSAIAYPSAAPTLHQITKMQQMTSEVCAATTTPAKTATRLDWDGSYQGDNTYVPRNSLQDTRDGKYYLVSKLADGNCWMSQNLELMLDSTEALTDEMTDLNTKTSWIPENSTLTEVPTSATWPNTHSAASSSAYSYYPIASDRYYQGGTEKSSTPTTSGAEYDWEKTGVYYNWFAATAGSGSLVSWGSAEDSICPKGWMLPPQGRDVKSFYELLNIKYNVRGPELISSPFNFVRAGFYDHYYSTMDTQGSDGWVWNSTKYGNAGHLHFYDTSYSASNGSADGRGLSVRCVAR